MVGLEVDFLLEEKEKKNRNNLYILYAKLNIYITTISLIILSYIKSKILLNG